MMRHFKSKPKRFVISTLLFLILLAAGGKEYPQENADTGQLDSYIENAGKDWKIPGMAAAIVKDGQVVLAKGYGLREFSKPEKVDEKTLFAIASNTKAFTAATLDGMISRVALVPEIKLGLVVLTNSINDLPKALMYRIIDTYLEVTPRDWSRIYLDRYRESIEKEKQQLAEITKNKTPCPVKLEDYTGRYGGPMYGDARVSRENKNLVLRFLPAPVLISDLSHLHYDTFQLKLRNTLSFIPHGMGTVQFMRDKNGNVVEMKVDIPNQDFWFHELEFKKKE
jgi:hypothetical protein